MALVSGMYSMLRALLLSTMAISLGGGLSACSTVTENIPTVKIERKKAKQVQSAESLHTVQHASYTAPKVQKAEAAMVCENDNMRERATDRNMENDTARVLILEEGGRSSNIIADVEVNCREYFQSQQSQTFRTVETIPTYTLNQSAPISASTQQIRQAVIPAPAISPRTKPQTIKASTPIEAADGYYYSIKRGDTLYGIARDNCSSVNDIARLNNIADPTRIEIHQIIRLPAQKCNTRK